MQHNRYRQPAELPQDQFSTAIAIEKCGCSLLLDQINHGFWDIGPFNSNGILNAIPQEVQDIRPSFNNDNGIRLQDIWAGGTFSSPRDPIFSIRRVWRTSSSSSSLSIVPSSNRSIRISFARSTIFFRLLTRISSIDWTLTPALRRGPPDRSFQGMLQESQSLPGQGTWR